MHVDLLSHHASHAAFPDAPCRTTDTCAATRRRRTARTAAAGRARCSASCTSTRCTSVWHFRQYHSNASTQAGRPPVLDDEPDAVRRPLRRMAHVRRQQEHVAGANRHVARTPVLHDAQHHVARELVEELLERIVVIVGALVGSADERDDEVGVLPDLRVANRRLQQVAMLVDPPGEVERCAHHCDLPRLGAHATALISMRMCGCGSWCTATVVRAGRHGRRIRHRPRCSRRSRPCRRGRRTTRPRRTTRHPPPRGCATGSR